MIAEVWVVAQPVDGLSDSEGGGFDHQAIHSVGDQLGESASISTDDDGSLLLPCLQNREAVVLTERRSHYTSGLVIQSISVIVRN